MPFLIEQGLLPEDGQSEAAPNWQKSENKKLLLKTSGKKFIFKLNCLVKVTLFNLKKLNTPNKSFKTLDQTLTNPEVVFSDGSIRQLLIF